MTDEIHHVAMTAAARLYSNPSLSYSRVQDTTNSDQERLLSEVVELQRLRDAAFWYAQELRAKYNLRMPGDPYPKMGDDFVDEVLRTLQRLRIDPFTGKVT